MNIQEKLQADLEAARQAVAEAQAKVAALEAQLANLPPEVAGVAHDRWDEIVAWFKGL